jgi:hypothetical protein
VGTASMKGPRIRRLWMGPECSTAPGSEAFTIPQLIDLLVGHRLLVRR